MVGSTGGVQLGICVLFLTTSWITVCLRFLVRGRMMHMLGCDDTAMLVATVIYSGFCAVMIKVTTLGGGSKTTTFSGFNTAMAWVIADESLYLLVMIFLKISLSLYFLRVIIVQWQRKCLYALIIINTVVNTVTIGFTIFLCGRPEDYVDKILTGKCISIPGQLGILYTQAAITTTTDWVLVLILFMLVWNLKMSARTKLTVVLIMGLAVVGGSGSVVRFFYLKGMTEVDNFFWNASMTALWSAVELGTGITAGNLATLRPLLRRLLRRPKSYETIYHEVETMTVNGSPQMLIGPSHGSRKQALLTAGPEAREVLDPTNTKNTMPVRLCPVHLMSSRSRAADDYEIRPAE